MSMREQAFELLERWALERSLQEAWREIEEYEKCRTR